jgi:hypothetical protein
VPFRKATLAERRASAKVPVVMPVALIPVRLEAEPMKELALTTAAVTVPAKEAVSPTNSLLGV